jgi:tetratricopeptide (TPR) repeat protein
MLYKNDYSKDREFRTDRMREAEGRRLARIAHQNSTDSSWPMRRKPLIAVAIIVVLTLSSLLFPQMTNAQDLTDSGSGEAYPDAMAAYRMGRYYFARENYDRAIIRYEEAIEGIPAEAFEAIAGYANIYWDMGEAQFMAGEPVEALASYQRYVELAGDYARPEAAAYVQQLALALADGPVTEVTLISG